MEGKKTMNLLHDFVKKTTIYQKLQRDLSMTNSEYEKLIFKYEEQCKLIKQRNDDVDKACCEILEKNTIIKHNKTNARKILKLTKDKDIRKLCNKILKGEK